MKLIIREPLKSEWAGRDIFQVVESVGGETVRAVQKRRTLRFEVKGAGYYLKYHKGTTWKEIFKNLLCLRLPIISAYQEWQAVEKLHQLGVDTMEAVAFGERGFNPVSKESFIITKDLSPTVSLEDYCRDWVKTPPSVKSKRILIKKLAKTVGDMHRGGVNHRDCYLCHFHLHLPFDESIENPKLSVIDLHRSQIRNEVPKRWRDKDLIGLYYSAQNIGLTRLDILRFMKLYFRKTLREIMKEEAELIEKAEAGVKRIREHTQRRNL